jgi:hypothetical protein
MKHAYASRRRRRGGYGTRQDRQHIYGGAALAAFLAWYWSLLSWSGWLAPYKETRFKKSAMQSKGARAGFFSKPRR